MFGFFKKAKQAVNIEKRAIIIRNTYKIAMKDVLIENGVNPAAIDNFPIQTLFRVPEATILTILESYTAIKSQTPHIEDQYVFPIIEDMRSSAAEGSKAYPNNNLLNYITYRIGLEHGRLSDGYLSKDVIRKIILFMKSQFSQDFARHINV